MKLELSSPHTNKIVRDDTLKPTDFGVAGIDVVDSYGEKHFARIIVLGYGQSDADMLAALVVENAKLAALVVAQDETPYAWPTPNKQTHCGPCSGRRGYDVFHPKGPCS